MNKNSYFFYIDVLTVVSTLAVVFLHANTVFWAGPSVSGGGVFTWVTANIIETVFYFAVPIFFMISGVGLMNYRDRYDTKTYFERRIKRVFVPFIFWSLASMLIYALSQPLEFSIRNVYEAIVTNKYMSIYWFFIPLLSIYLAIPVLSLLRGNVSIFLYMIVYASVTYCFLPNILSLLKLPYNWGIQSPISSGFLIYPLIGYYLSVTPLSKNKRVMIYLLGLLGLLVHCAGTLILSEDQINQTFKGYMNWPCLLYSVSVFVFFQYCDYSDWRRCVVSVFKYLKGASFGVYLMHFYVLQFSWNYLGISQVSLWSRILLALTVFILCSLLVKTVQTTKVGRTFVFP